MAVQSHGVQNPALLKCWHGMAMCPRRLQIPALLKCGGQDYEPTEFGEDDLEI